MHPLRPSRTGKCLAPLALALATAAMAEDSTWISLFNGKDLDDWDIKFTKSPLNTNFRNTVKVADSAITIDYGGWSSWGGEFGHIGYKVRPFSYYLLRAEYQVGAAQAPGGPGWARQNNGLMLHSQPVATMTLNQDFPISLEAQLLGSNGGADGNSTMNLCTPGTGFHTQATGGSVNSSHCHSAADNTRPAPGTWAWVSASVMGDSVIRHYIGPNPSGTPTLTYYRTVYLKGNVENPPANTPADGTPLKSGYIVIQAESHAYKFRKIEVLDLEGCMDRNSPAYRSYFVKSKPGACTPATGTRFAGARPQGLALDRTASGYALKSPRAGVLEVATLSGTVLFRKVLAGNSRCDFRLPGSGLALLKWRSGKETWTQPLAGF